MRPRPAAIRHAVAAAFAAAAASTPAAWAQVGLPASAALPAVRVQELPTIERFVLADGGSLQFFTRRAAPVPAAYRALVIPGSGCAGLATIADRYFRGLAHADVTVLHKRHVDALAWPAPRPCPPAFVREDRLSRWLADASAFVTALRDADPRPLLLVGISEGAEVVPRLALAHPWIAHVALVSGTGLNPIETYALQARREHHSFEIEELRQWAGDAALADDAVRGGRSVGYWRDLLGWPVTEPLLALPQPVAIGFGERDASLPQQALQHFADRAGSSGKAVQIRIYPGADHGLLDETGDDAPLQHFWHQLDSAMQAAQR